VTLPPVTITISDQATLAYAQTAARQAGHADWTAWLREQARQGTRLALGMKADLSVAAAARYLGCHTNTIWNYHKRGDLPGLYYVSAKKAMIPLADLERFKERCKVAA
jgi:hypothetical protein